MRLIVTSLVALLSISNAWAAAPSPDAYTLEHALTLRSFSGLAWSGDGRRSET